MDKIRPPAAEFKPSGHHRSAIDPPLDFHLARACQSLHALGPRALFEFIKEVEGAHPGARELIRERLAIYNSLDASHIKTLTNSGGFPPPPLYQVLP